MFLKVNCAAVPADLLESELFGYEQGAFTGAVKTKPGKFEICTAARFFLMRSERLPAMLQAKLLQVLQDGTFMRLGSRAPMQVDVRVIAATTHQHEGGDGEQDLSRGPLLPAERIYAIDSPLRQRKEEIPVLAEYFMRRAAKRYSRDPLLFSGMLIQALTEYTWPGNIRELENVINRYLVMGEERSILDELAMHGGGERVTSSAANDSGTSAGGLKQMVRSLKGEAEATAIQQVLEGVGWNRKAAATDLKISYKALLYKIKQYELSPPGQF